MADSPTAAIHRSVRRRGVVPGLLALWFIVACSSGEPAPQSPADDDRDPQAQLHERDEAFSALESEYDGVVGVYAYATATGDAVAYRADERFGYASTHKAFSAGAVLAGLAPDDLDRAIAIDPAAIVAHSPVTEPAAGSTLPLREVLRAAVIDSDNTAANLLFDELGGPEGFEQFLRSIGDEVTSADRRETELNAWSPGEQRDTTTARQAVATLETLLLGDVLEDWAAEELRGAMRDVTTADGLIRAAAPESVIVANKSGAAAHGLRADIALLERPDAEPVLLAVYTHGNDPDADWSDAFVAEAAAIALDALL